MTQPIRLRFGHSACPEKKRLRPISSVGATDSISPSNVKPRNRWCARCLKNWVCAGCSRRPNMLCPGARKGALRILHNICCGKSTVVHTELMLSSELMKSSIVRLLSYAAVIIYRTGDHLKDNSFRRSCYSTMEFFQEFLSVRIILTNRHLAFVQLF